MRPIGINTKLALDRIDHPPTAEQMKDVMHALAWDGDIERVECLADTMTAHHGYRRDDERYDHSYAGRDLAADHQRNFYYWLGARGVAMSMNNSRRARRERRNHGVRQ